MIPNIYDTDFMKEVLNEEKLVLVDFSAIWCGPCKMVAPILEEIAYENDNVKIVKMDVDVSPFISRKYRINSIPNIKFFKNGRVVDEIIGFVPKRQIEEVINRNLEQYIDEEFYQIHLLILLNLLFSQCARLCGILHHHL